MDSRYRRSGGVGLVELEAEQVLCGCHAADRGGHEVIATMLLAYGHQS